MKKIELILILFLFILQSCQQTASDKVVKSLRDSTLKEYLFYTDSLLRHDSTTYYFDSSDYNYRLLAAYYINDTSSLLRYLADIDKNRNNQFSRKPENRGLILKKMEVDEAYQFIYDRTFCPYAYNLTISKKGTVFSLHSIVYERNEPNGEFKLIKEYDKQLTENNWSNILSALDFADYWQLKERGKLGCCDGDFILVNAIVRRPVDSQILKYYSVNRQFVEGTALYKAYELVFVLSQVTEKCK